jgi:hypothetical protein
VVAGFSPAGSVVEASVGPGQLLADVPQELLSRAHRTGAIDVRGGDGQADRSRGHLLIEGLGPVGDVQQAVGDLDGIAPPHVHGLGRPEGDPSVGVGSQVGGDHPGGQLEIGALAVGEHQLSPARPGDVGQAL